MRVLVIDNYDSFTYNLVHLIGGLGADIEVVRNDKIDLDGIARNNPDAIVISPGPGTPSDAGICVPLIAQFHDKIPIFGVCLGMQSMADALGGKVVHAPNLMHGKTSKIAHSSKGVFRGINDDFVATRYHSLAVDQDSLPDFLEPTAYSVDDKVLMGMQHKSSPLHGVQFHPESISSEGGAAMLGNFLELAKAFNDAHR